MIETLRIARLPRRQWPAEIATLTQTIRERTDRLRAVSGDRMFPADENGRAGDRFVLLQKRRLKTRKYELDGRKRSRAERLYGRMGGRRKFLSFVPQCGLSIGNARTAF